MVQNKDVYCKGILEVIGKNAYFAPGHLVVLYKETNTGKLIGKYKRGKCGL